MKEVRNAKIDSGMSNFMHGGARTEFPKAQMVFGQYVASELRSIKTFTYGLLELLL